MTSFLALESFADAPAIFCANGDSLSYRQLLARADETIAGLSARMLVAIECANHVEVVAAYLGCLRAGIVPLLVDESLDVALRERLYQCFAVAAVWRRPTPEGSYAWQYRRVESPDLHPDLGLLLSTSGSTGSPRLVRLSRRNLESNARSIVAYLGLDNSERPITSLPLHYSYGLSVLNSHLACGASLLLTDESMMSRGFWTFFNEAAATSLSGVPMHYEMLRRLRFERMRLPSLRTLTQAGGRLAPETTAWFATLARERQQRFFVMYGQTEATARMAYLPPEYVLKRPDSIGIAIPGGEFFLRSQDGALITAAGVEGELVYRGPNVMMGYAESPEHLALPDQMQGEVATGDIARRDEDGFYYITGRLKRFIKIHGNRVGLDEVERHLQARGFPVLVVGRDDQLVIALIEPGADAAAVVADVIRTFHFHASVVFARYCNDIPRSAAGKVQYQALLQKMDELKKADVHA